MTYEEIKKFISYAQDDAQKLEIVMDIGKTLLPVPDAAKCNEILGCVSFVQICEKDGRFYGMADSMMVRGIVAIILAMVDGKTIPEIKQMDIIGKFNKLNLNFGASRLNGIQTMVNFFKNL